MLKKKQVEELEQLAFDKTKRALSNNRLSTATSLIELLLGLKELQKDSPGSESTHAIGFVQHTEDDSEDCEEDKQNEK